MKNESLLNQAISIAFEAHQHQRDKFGQSYIGHLTRVMNKGRTVDEKIVGILHDLLEDTDWTTDGLLAQGFPLYLVAAIQCLTKKDENEPYEEFIQRVLTNSLAAQVKLYDLSDNLDILRMPEVTERDVPRLNKYLIAFRTIVEHSAKGAATTSSASVG